MTTEHLNQLINLLASITLFEMMVAIGLGVSLDEVLCVAKDWRLVSRAALASYVCVPAAAVGLLILFRPDPYVAAGFLIAAVCPGAPYGPPFTGMAKGNVPLSVGLMVILAGSSALIAPVLLQFLLPFVLQFLSVRHWRPVLAENLKKPANLLSMVLNLSMLGLIVYVQFDMLIGIPLRGFIGMLALVLAGVAAGWFFGGSGNRSAIVMATSVRNVGVSLVIVTAAFAGTRAVGAAVAFALFQTIVMALAALACGFMARAGTAPADSR